MNNRIRKLAEQAGLKYYNWSTNESNIVNSEFKYPRIEDYEKFAELIIAECIDQVEVFNARMDAGPRHIVEAIKQHFGVEE